jgi:hypothetical protein
MSKYEQLIEFIINENEDKARELFHQLVIEKSRDIYESLIDEEDFDEGIGGNQVTGLMKDVEQDEHGMQEAEDEFGGEESGEFGSDADMGGDEMPTDDAFGDVGDDMGGEPDGGVETKIQDIELALDDLKAEFEKLMGGDADEMGGDDMADMGGDDMGSDDEMEFGDEEPEGMVREYVEKGGKDWPRGESEGTAVGAKGEATAVNKQSIVAKSNHMGGTSANIVKGGTEQSADGKPVPTPNNQYTKGRGELKGAGSFQNVPGAKTKGYTNKATSYEKQHGAEGQTTDGKLPVNPKSLSGGKVR